MIIAWMLCATTAVLMAKYYKPMWPNEMLCWDKIWYSVSVDVNLVLGVDNLLLTQVHRGCMLTCFGCTVLGFILIFVHRKAYSTVGDIHCNFIHPINLRSLQMPDLPDKAHPPLGITVTILAVLNVSN